jgi:serine/alanine adding enzyme
MIKVVEYNDNYKEAWMKYVNDSSRATVAHQIEWLAVMRKGLGHQPRYLLAIDNDRLKGILPLVIVKTWWQAKYLISLPWIDYGGVCADNTAAAKILLDKACHVAQGEKVKFMELRSVEAIESDLAAGRDKVTFLLRLGGDTDKILKSFDAKLRNQIRKSQKSGLSAEFGGLELLPDFYKIFSWKMHDLGTPVWGYGFFKSILESLPDRARIILISHGEKPIAGGLVLSFKDRLYVPSASAYRSSLKYCPNHALYWKVIKRGCEQGYKYFDFGRSAVDSPTFKFKKQWVTESTPLNWQYYLNRTKEVPAINPNNPKYKIFIRLWRRLPLPVANFLGPKVIKNFP